MPFATSVVPSTAARRCAMAFAPSCSASSSLPYTWMVTPDPLRADIAFIMEAEPSAATSYGRPFAFSLMAAATSLPVRGPSSRTVT